MPHHEGRLYDLLNYCAVPRTCQQWTSREKYRIRAGMNFPGVSPSLQLFVVERLSVPRIAFNSILNNTPINVSY